MTRTEAQTAMNARSKVAAGEADDYDTGWIMTITGDMAEVSWDSGVQTPCPISDLNDA